MRRKSFFDKHEDFVFKIVMASVMTLFAVGCVALTIAIVLTFSGIINKTH